ncbi:MAG: hypothetical protein ACRCYU_24325 [Nocardioides sp.]
MSGPVKLPTAEDRAQSTAQLPEPGSIPAIEKVTGSARRPSGRIRHDEKMTIYVTGDELIEVERARLALRSVHGLAVDRGRLVREAVAIALADFDHHGEDSVLVQRLIGS